MFDFLFAPPYEERMVDRFEAEWGFISTAAVIDSKDPFETAVSHVLYGEGTIVIVETYPSKDRAQEGHDRWVETMSGKNLPDKLKDVSSYIGALMLPEGEKDQVKSEPDA